MAITLPVYSTNVNLYAHVPAIEIPNILNVMSTSFKTYMNSSISALETYVNSTIEPDLQTFKSGILNDISAFAVSTTSYSTLDINQILAGNTGATYAVNSSGFVTSATDGVVSFSNISYDIEDRIVAYTVTIIKNSVTSVYQFVVVYDSAGIPTITLMIV